MAANVEALQNRLSDSTALKRYDEIAKILTGNVKAKAGDGVEWVEDLCRELDMPALASHGLKQTDFVALTEKALRASSMQGNPIKLTEHEIGKILSKAL